MMARPPAAAVPRKKDDARLQKGPGMQKRPAAAKERAASETRLLPELVAMPATMNPPEARRGAHPAGSERPGAQAMRRATLQAERAIANHVIRRFHPS